MFLRKIRVIAILTLSLILVTSAFTLRINGQTEDDGITNLEGINVAVYGGEGAVNHCAIALFSLFEWLNASVDWINASNILDGELENYDIVAYPGGNAFDYHMELGNEGINHIREFVSNGGSYVGICGGSTFACEYNLELFNGTRTFTPYEGVGPYLIDMTVNHECEGPDLSDLPDTYSTMYWGSVRFIPAEGFDVHPIALYGLGGGIGMLTFNYDHGTVFISSPHPEYEEGSDRDGTDFCDELDDPDSEYELLRRVMIWLIEESPYTPSPETTDTTMSTTTDTNTTTSDTANTNFTAVYLLGSIGAAAIIVVVVAIVYKSRG